MDDGRTEADSPTGTNGAGRRRLQVLKAVVETLSYLTHLAKDKQAAEIYRILGSSKSEKTRKILRVLEMDSETEWRAGASSGEPDKSAEASSPSSMTNQKLHTESAK